MQMLPALLVDELAPYHGGAGPKGVPAQMFGIRNRQIKKSSNLATHSG